MEASSTTTRSASSGRSWLKAASPPGRSSSSRCRVWASIPASSDRRLAARPVGAARSTRAFLAWARATTARTVKLLPQPGPPVSTATRSVRARRTAVSCSGASRLPVTSSSQAKAAAQSTLRNMGNRSAWEGTERRRSSPAASDTSARWNGSR